MQKPESDFYQSKRYNELEFLKKLLNDVGINNVSSPISTTCASQICITTRKELENFRKLIGFGHHIDKNKKLGKILADYSDLPYKTAKTVRYAQILSAMETHDKISCKDIAESTKLKESYVNKLINEMLQRGLMLADKSSVPFKYTTQN